MDAELFIHGPRHAYYGKQEDSQYCQLFDNSQIKDEIRFVVEIRKGGNGKWYTYYTYCRYANILDIDGRNGAYIGLTVRLDAYYANLRNLYTILEATFNAKVVGLLVKKSGNTFQYLVSDFRNSQQSILNNIEKSLGAMLAGSISTSDVFPIDSSFTTGGNEIVKGLDDNQYSEARMTDIKRTGRLVFASSAEIDKIAKLNKEFDLKQEAIKADLQKGFSKIQRELDDANNKNNSLKEEMYQKERQIETLQDVEKQLNARIDSFSSFQEKIPQLQNLVSQLQSERHELESKLKERNNDINRLNAKVQYLEEDIQKLKNSSKDMASDNGCSGNNSPQELPHSKDPHRHPDSISNKWRFSELGEGLKIGICAFFLLALAAVIYRLVFTYKSISDNTESDTIKEEVVRGPKVRTPNELIDKIFPDSTMVNQLEIKQMDNHFNLELETPKINIDEHEWIIKDSKYED